MKPQIIDRQTAASLGMKRFFTGNPCVNGHISERSVSRGRCLQCHADYMRTKCAESRLEATRRWRKRNPDHYKEYYAKTESERLRCKNRKYNPENGTKNSKAWRKRNPEKVRASVNARSALRRTACPPWANKDAIRAIYLECQRISMMTGVKHHVDHIFPLKGKYSCGLHVPENLRIIPATENLSKHNKEPIMVR